jgi:hypothetical protein
MPAPAHEYATDPKLRDWYESLKQPDNPTASCCGEADSYFADDVERGPNGEWIAIITDGRDDMVPDPYNSSGFRLRVHRPPGTRIVVPNAKVKIDQGNPTGHGIIFMPISNTDEFGKDQSGRPVTPYCYFPPQLA